MPETAEKNIPSSWVYRYQNGLYVNLTNRCPTACAFCIKSAWKMRYRGYDLRLRKEPAAQEVLREVAGAAAFGELIFCGYGEPTYRLQEMLEIARHLKAEWKRRPDAPRIRLNTVGLGSLIHGRDIVADLTGSIDSVSVSLNTADPKQWLSLMRPAAPYRKEGFESVLRFIRLCARLLPETCVTAVDLPEVDIAKCRSTARALGAKFRLRPLLDP
ncbi:MAG: radical SAM protein [Elusimicrobia bacterium]|nr:radical SAM protein [Elusimicrobiota bacterium]